MTKNILTIILLFLFTTITDSPTSALFVWNPSVSSDVAGYKVYFGTPPGTYSKNIDVGNTTDITITNLEPGKTYSLYVIAYSAMGTTSPPSNIIEYTVPENHLQRITTLRFD